jgi:uncharacterized RDD family membrane protein YckC
MEHFPRDEQSPLAGVGSLSIAGLEAGRAEAARVPRTAQPGGFWRRAVALSLDGIVVSVLRLPFTLLAALLLAGRGNVFSAMISDADPTVQFQLQLVGMIVQIAIVCAYYGYYYPRMGATPGKRVMGLKVVDARTGAYPTAGNAIFRETVGKSVSSITLGIGFLMAAFRSDKRALHDLMAGTRVFRS